MKKKVYESELPAGYRQVYYLNAKSKKVGILLNLVATAVALALVVVGILPLFVLRVPFFDAYAAWSFLFPLLFLVSMLAYLVLHELVHGLAYKLFTHERLTFGISWSCAFCGVPQIYTYRKTALVAVLAPFVLFSLLFLGLAAFLWTVGPIPYVLAVLLFAVHVGGCSGDLYVALLLVFRYRSKRLLMRDTGPEQYFYLPEQQK